MCKVDAHVAKYRRRRTGCGFLTDLGAPSGPMAGAPTSALLLLALGLAGVSASGDALAWVRRGARGRGARQRGARGRPRAASARAARRHAAVWCHDRAPPGADSVHSGCGRAVAPRVPRRPPPAAWRGARAQNVAARRGAPDPPPPPPPPPPRCQVTCGSTLKLAHETSKARLHSHEVSYSRGSQQQSVTAFPESDDANSYWLVQGTVVRALRRARNASRAPRAAGPRARPALANACCRAPRGPRRGCAAHGRCPHAPPPPQAQPCTPGAPVAKKQKLRLQHTATRRWLHSHLFQSPLSGNQEVRPRLPRNTRGPPLLAAACAAATAAVQPARAAFAAGARRAALTPARR